MSRFVLISNFIITDLHGFSDAIKHACGVTTYFCSTKSVGLAGLEIEKICKPGRYFIIIQKIFKNRIIFYKKNNFVIL